MSLEVPLAIRVKGGGQDRHITREARSLTFRSTIPGGFASCQVQLDRPLALDPEELQIYSDLYVYDGRSGAVVWQGRLEDPGRGAGARGQIWTVRAAGPSAHARDHKIRLIYVDTSLERWFPTGGANLNREGGEDLLLSDASSDPALQMRLPRGEVAVVGWFHGMMYRDISEGAQSLARVAYSWDAGITNVAWFLETVTRAGIGGGGTVQQDAFNTAGGTAAFVVVTDFAAGHNHVELRILRETAQYTSGGEDVWGKFISPVVRARLWDRDGAVINTGYTADTVLASEVVEDLLGREAGGISILAAYDGPNATVETTSKTIDQLAYPDGATPERVLADMMIIEPTFYWAAWEGSPARFEWRTWPTTIRYETTAADGFDSPASAAELFNRVTVRWRDPQGRIRRTSRTNTVQALTDAGLTREGYIDLADEFGSSSVADDVGDAFLTEHASPPNAGTLTVKRPIQDLLAGRSVSPWELRPGNLIRVRDVRPNVDALNATNRDAVTVFRIVAVTYNAADNAARLELDSRPRELAGLLAASQRRIDQLRKR